MSRYSPLYWVSCAVCLLGTMQNGICVLKGVGIVLIAPDPNRPASFVTVPGRRNVAGDMIKKDTYDG